MNTIKTIFLSSLIFLLAKTSNAQNGMKEPVAFKLKNGMQIIVSENERSPKAYSNFTLDATAFEGKKDGIEELLNAVLNEGAVKNANISFNDKSGKLTTSNAELSQDLTAMANLIQHAVIDQKTFSSAKTKLLSSLKSKSYDFDSKVNETSINALTLADVRDFYNQISPANTYLTVAGNIELDAAKNAVKKAFGNWATTKDDHTLSAK